MNKYDREFYLIDGHYYKGFPISENFSGDDKFTIQYYGETKEFDTFDDATKFIDSILRSFFGEEYK